MKPSHPGFLRKVIIGTFISVIGLLSKVQAQCSAFVLNTQEAIDSFQSDFGCTVIEGQLLISGADVQNLNGLSAITQVYWLSIYNTSLTSLEGMEALTIIRAGLDIQDNTELTSLNGLQNLSSVGYIDIRIAPKLTDISQLSEITSTGGPKVQDGNLIIRECPTLQTLDGLQNITNVDGYLWIEHNPALQHLLHLNKLQFVGKTFWINDNDALPDLSGLESLTHVNRLGIVEHASMISLNGLYGLSDIPGGLVIQNNQMLTSLNGLENISNIGTELKIQSGPIMSLQPLLSLQTVGGDPDASPMQGLLFDNLPELNGLEGLENLSTISGALLLDDVDKIQTVNGLNQLNTIGGHLIIRFNNELTSLEGFQRLETIGRNLTVRDNVKLSSCSIESICSYFLNPPGTSLILFNSQTHPGCNSQSEIQARCSPFKEMKIIDANPGLNGMQSVDDLRKLSPDELLELNVFRDGVAADGISKVVLRIHYQEKGRISILNTNGNFEFPWSDTTYLSEGKHYCFILFTPPAEFDQVATTYMLKNDVEAYHMELAIEFTGKSNVWDINKTIPIVRPPVVLIHGTYSNPVKAWKTPVDGGISLFDRVASEGFKVFAVNYEESNGTTGLFTDISSFQDNAKVAWGNVYPSNKDGIKDALIYYRDSLRIATTQADVVGHSLGGILARVYASAYFNADYKRPENFMNGDINRLITLASTHFGSHLGELQTFLEGLSPFDIGALDWIALQAVNSISAWAGGASPGKAVIDQLPEPSGEALRSIGRTEIPSHAITCRVQKGGLKDAIHDPFEEYYDLYWYITLLMYQSDDIRDAYLNSKLELIDIGLQASTTLEGGDPQELFPGYNNLLLYKTMIEDAIHRSGQVLSVMDGTFELPSEIDVFKYALGEVGMGDLADPLLEVFVAGADPVGVVAEYLLPPVQVPSAESVLENYLRVHEESIEGLRALVFNNDDNDGVVRVQSQSGELEKECSGCVTHVDNVLHGFAPRYTAIQDRVVELLNGGMTSFHPGGFPPADHAQLIYYPPEKLDLFKIPLRGGAAICQSGMEPSHARAFAHLADEQNVIIMTRPVNPDGTELIAQGAATKVMDVKPKSSNWGPQKGYLPVKQRYSKLWKVFEGDERMHKIAKYDSLAQENLSSGITIARQLQVEACNGLFTVFIDENKIGGPEDQNAADEVVLVPEYDSSTVCYWLPEFSSSQFIENCESRGAEHLLTPLEVMATPDVVEDDGITPRYLTADYDLLMVGFFEGEDQGPPMPPDVPFKPGVGQITGEQENLIEMLNEAIKEAGYQGGNVVHHGPENQFSKSPYIDYPVTVFAPDEIPNGFFSGPSDGIILSIEMGPPGFRDIHLKQFVNKMRSEGYDLYHNPQAPGWHWTWDTSAEAYELEDSPELIDYVEQLPENKCDKYGGQKREQCPFTIETDDTGNEKKESWLFDERNVGVSLNGNLSPNPVFGNSLQFTLGNMGNITFSCMVLDALGNLRTIQKINSGKNLVKVIVDVHELEPGVYTVLTDVYGQVGRFVKL